MQPPRHMSAMLYTQIVLEKGPANDAASTPHECDAAVVEIPAVDLGRLAEQHEALGIGDDLGGIECLADVLYEGLSGGKGGGGREGEETK